MLLMSACEDRQAGTTCDSHSDAVSCLADEACGWRTDMSECKAVHGGEGTGQ